MGLAVVVELQVVVVQLVHQDPVVQLVLVEVVVQVVGVLHCLLVVYILLQAVGHADL